MKREIWCDHCQTRYIADNTVAVCRQCKGVTLVVECRWCGEWSEIARPLERETWYCVTCKEDRHYREGVLEKYFSTANSLEEVYRRIRVQDRQAGSQIMERRLEKAGHQFKMIAFMVTVVILIAFVTQCAAYLAY